MVPMVRALTKSRRLVRADVISHNAVITGSTWSVALQLGTVSVCFGTGSSGCPSTPKCPKWIEVDDP